MGFHIPKLWQILKRFVFKITGLSKDDAKRAPMCTRERTICECRSKKCESGKYVTF